MKNYKLKAFNKLYEETTSKAFLNDKAVCFIDDIDADCGSYFCDAIQEVADNHTSIYYSDIKEFICNHFDKVEEAINEFGWDGCGCDLYQAGQTAEFLANEQEIYEDFADIVKHLAMNFIESTEEASDEAERIFSSLSEIEQERLVDEFISELESIDTNDRIETIVDVYNSYVQSILNEEGNE
jgi:hypothetical protein